MSFLTRTWGPLRTARALPLRSLVSFHTSSARRALSEDDLGDPDRAEKIEASKRDSVNKAKSGKGEWKPELATQTEQIIHADKSGLSLDELENLGAPKSEQDQKLTGSESSKKTA